MSKFFNEWIQKRAPQDSLYHPHLAVLQELASYENANRIKTECSKKNVSLLTEFKLFCPNSQMNVYSCRNKLSTLSPNPFGDKSPKTQYKLPDIWRRQQTVKKLLTKTHSF